MYKLLFREELFKFLKIHFTSIKCITYNVNYKLVIFTILVAFSVNLLVILLVVQLRNKITRDNYIIQCWSVNRGKIHCKLSILNFYKRNKLLNCNFQVKTTFNWRSKCIINEGNSRQRKSIKWSLLSLQKCQNGKQISLFWSHRISFNSTSRG